MTAIRLNQGSDVERVVLNKASGFTRGECILTRVGKVVHISAHFYNSTDVATNTALFETIPSALRPPFGYAIPAVLVNGGGDFAAYTLTVNANGTVTQGFSGYMRSFFAAGEYQLA